jgi:tyrosyl-tRNA synthetase
MSKSLNNAIGIQEPPLEMYGKLMSISDAMMWRYYELLTDVQLPEIEKMKRDSHPMQAKKDLAHRIVTDFHSADAAARGAEDWAKQFQKDEAPENVEAVAVPLAEVATQDGEVNLAKLIARAGLAASVSEAARKIKEKAVRINGEVTTSPAISLAPGSDDQSSLTVRVGRKIRRVTFIR